MEASAMSFSLDRLICRRHNVYYTYHCHYQSSTVPNSDCSMLSEVCSQHAQTNRAGLLCCLVKGVAEIIIQATTTKGKACKLIDISPIFLVIIYGGTCSMAPDYSGYCNENNTPFLLMIIPNVLEGFAFLLVFMTTLEFICAQAPLRLKGCLIGIWYALLAVDYLVVGISEIFLIDITIWEVFYEGKAFLIFCHLCRTHFCPKIIHIMFKTRWWMSNF